MPTTRPRPASVLLSALAAGLALVLLPSPAAAGNARAEATGRSVATLAAQEAPDTAGQAASDTADPGSGEPGMAQDAPPEPAPVTGDRAVLDREAEETLAALLDRMQGLRGVRVTVEAGLARLEGEVPSAEARDRAEAVARQIEGVSFVDNRIELSSSVTDQLAPALERLEDRLGDLLATLPALGVALLAVLFGILLAGWAGGLRWPYETLTRNPFLQNVLRQIVRTVMVVAGVLVAVEILDVTALVGAVVGTAGVAGIALGFAFKDIVENYLSGLLLSLRQPFSPNDTVELDGRQAKVVRLTARETILMDLDGNHVRIPNAAVFRGVLVNYTRNPKRRFAVDITVGPNEELTHAMEVGREVLHEMVGVLDDPTPTARVVEVGDSWVALRWHGWMDQREADFGKVRSEATRLVLERLGAEGVATPPPEYRVHVVGDAGAVDAGTEEGDGVAATGQDEPPRPPARQQDVSPDRTLDEQIEEDRRSSDEPDLLGEGAGG